MEWRIAAHDRQCGTNDFISGELKPALKKEFFMKKLFFLKIQIKIIVILSLITFTLIYPCQYDIDEKIGHKIEELKSSWLIKWGNQASSETLIMPHEVRILNIFGKIKRRILYEENDVTTIGLNFDNYAIAPKKFCAKIAQIANQLQYPMPITPIITSNENEQYTAAIRNGFKIGQI